VTAMATHWVIIASAGKKARMYTLAESRLGGERWRNEKAASASLVAVSDQAAARVYESRRG
jgi:hypothetical protein